MYANGSPNPILSNQNINQFLDNDNEVLNIRNWFSSRIAGPVLGHLSDTTASVQYRVEREGSYRFELYLHGVTTPLQVIDKSLQPSAVFKMTSLQPNTHYDFKFYYILNGQPVHLPEGDGSFRTFPIEGTGVKFAFGIGSCAKNKKNPIQTVWTHVKNISLDPSIDILGVQPANDLRFFIHTGDTFYFYDDVTHIDMASLSSSETLSVSRAAHISARLNSNFLDMAKRVPTCAVWDDHDFRYNDKDGSNFPNKTLVKQTFLEYWANPEPFNSNYGLSCRMSYGNVDIYLLDGRYSRIKSQGQMFSSAQCSFIIQDIESRGADKIRVLVSDSTWNHTDNPDDEHYGYSGYNAEREVFYSNLNSLVGQSKIKGLIFVSGDIHMNEIYEIKLATNGKVAPELISSPLGENVGLKPARTITGERKWSKSSKIQSGEYWGFASLHIDTREPGPRTVDVKYRRYDNGIVYYTKQYVLNNNQFVF